MLFNFNWIDLLMLVIIVRMINLGSKTKFIPEIMLLFGDFCTVFLVLHFFLKVSKLFGNVEVIPIHLLDMLGFLLLWITCFTVFKLISGGWDLLLRIETNKTFNKYSGMFIAGIRSVIFCSLIFMFIFSTGYPPVARYFSRSFTAAYLVDLSPRIYKSIYDNLIKNHFSTERLNIQVFALKNVGRPKIKKDINKPQQTTSDSY